MKKDPLKIVSISVAFLFGAVGSLVVAGADTELPNVSNLAERYNTSSLPSRADLQDQLPSLPTQFPLDPSVAREQGSRELQGLDRNQAMNPDTISTRLNRINSESANPANLTGAIPSSVSSLGRGVVNTQANPGVGGSSGSSVGANSPSDPLGSDPSRAADRQSAVTRDGTLPNGALNVSGGSPFDLADTLSGLVSTDAANSRTNYLASMLAMKVQVLNTQTATLAGKIDTVNQSHATLNRRMNSLVDKMDGVLRNLPTIPKL